MNVAATALALVLTFHSECACIRAANSFFSQGKEAYATIHPQPLVYFVCRSMSFFFVSNQSFTWIHVATTFMSIPQNMLGYSTCLVCVFFLLSAIFGSRLFSCLLFDSCSYFFPYFFNRHSKMFHFDCVAIYYILDKLENFHVTVGEDHTSSTNKGEQI